MFYRQKIMQKKLAVGGENFPDMIRKNCYYVDKTDFIKTVMESENRVMLITRPRRFGKTLFMDTLKNFLQMDFAKPGSTKQHEEMFAGKKVLQEQEFCRNFMGQYPVIFLSLKEVEGANYEKAYRQFAVKLSFVAAQYEFLLDSPNLTQREKAKLELYLDEDSLKDLSHEDDCKNFLKNMVVWLSKHFKRQVVLLIDEYDVPLAKAAKFGYYKDMLELVRSSLGNILKEDPQAALNASTYMYKAVLTGCLRVSKESIFTGINNPSVNTVCSNDKTLNESIGFNTEEVFSLLQYYGLENRYDDVKRWYDGYRFADCEIYCPWDVINFCDKALRSQNPALYQPENYWEGTSGNDVIDEFLGFLSAEDADMMQTLVDGGEIDLTINDKLTYGDFEQHDPRDFWTLLLYSGYLTVVKQLPSLNAFRVRIPNEEVRDSFINKVKSRFSKANKKFVSYGRDFAKAALNGDCDAMADILGPLLKNYVSVRDTATKAPAENYYHGFLSGLLGCAGEYAQDVLSNAEAGDGYADLTFTSGMGSKRIGVIIEIKRCKTKGDMYDYADAAVKQIEEKHYTAYLDRLRCGKKCVYGIAFCRKDCAISGGVLP